MISERLASARTRRMAQAMSRPWQGVQHGTGRCWPFPKGVPYKACGSDAPLGKGLAIASGSLLVRPRNAR